MGSDGIWDNLHDYMIYEIIEQKEMSIEKKAESLTWCAHNLGSESNYKSPFHLKAK